VLRADIGYLEWDIEVCWKVYGQQMPGDGTVPLPQPRS
jgi:hypothetical protein